ncbi:MAG: LysR family transcriptional regulator [Streptosporangiales bacterium]|nr:LysR family transcriptional regulator [Streptosporangiales bacterium]
MDVRQLEYFLAIVDHAGFNRAAKHLHLAQPSLSQAIRGLERHLGVMLFHRIGRRVVLTDAGRALIQPARQVLRDVDTARAAIDSLKGLTAGEVDIACMPTPAVEPLTSIIGRFSERYPDVSVRVLAEFTPGGVIDAVRTGVAQLGLLGTPQPVQAAGIELHLLQEQRFVLIMRPDHPLGNKASVTAADLAGTDLIVVQHGTGQRQVVDTISAQGVDVRIAVEVEHREAILPLVLEGVGVAVMTEAWTSLSRKFALRVVPLEPTSFLQIYLAHRRARLTPAAEAFLNVAVG